MKIKKYIFLSIVLAVMSSFSMAVPALAENGQNGSQNNEQAKTISGTVSAVSGNTITIAVKQESGSTTTTVNYTVNAANATITKNGVAGTIVSILVGDKISVQGAITGTSIAATVIRDGQNNQGENDSNKINPNIVGKVTAINGNILTISKKQESDKNIAATGTTLTIDATNAKILRGETVITVSSIAVGDNIVVQGTLTGTNVVATLIRDGKVGNGNEQDNNQALLQIQGNGQPVVIGKVTVISGSTLTITNSGNITYTINAASAKIVQGKNIILVSDVKVGDSVLVQGAVNGTVITASTIIDQANKVNSNGEGKKQGFFGSIGQWFRHLFGF